MATLFLTEEEVEGLLPMRDALPAVEEALRALGRGEAVNGPRQRVKLPGTVLHVMAAGWPERGYLGFKYYTATRKGVRFWFHLVDGNTGELVAIMEADRLGQQRTGATSGVATKYLAREDASVAGIVGTGWQAESQLMGVCAVRPIRHVRCYSRDASHRKTFARKMSPQLHLDVTPAASAEEAIRDADVVVAATTAKDPVVRGEWLKPGCHVNAIGANRAEVREADDEAIRRSTFIAVDSKEQAQAEGGDLIEPVAHGILSWDRVRELGDVVAGKARGRVRSEDITLFKSLGIAIEDVAVGALVYERARDRGIGRTIPLGDSHFRDA
jgi:ornithine cyclodeaminase/alanine dehydrogenase-like protein (mu-crystallin family)